MVKLKTLKDIWEETETINKEHNAIEIHSLRKMDFERIREAAKEWLNKLCEFKIMEVGNDFIYEVEDVKKWIKYFFNIDDEEKIK